MIIWFGEENDMRRGIKINLLKIHFTQTDVKPLHTLTLESLKDNRSYFTKLIVIQKKLIISGHGNDNIFMGQTAKKLFDTLCSKGLNSERFSSIYLLTCNAGHTEQDDSATSNFLREFGRYIKPNDVTSGIKVYGPRDRITWRLKTETKLGNDYEAIKEMKIVLRNPDNTVRESHDSSSGLLLYSQ